MSTPEPTGVLADTAAVLRAVLASVAAGDLPAETDQVAYLRGAADALALAADPSPPVTRARHT